MRRVLHFALLLALLPACGVQPPNPEKSAAVKPNRLAKERSPYLRQHQYNPVDWYPWGDEAFAKAKAEDKPIFLSVGYAACHWCHVMEHESFEDEATAKILNDAFVCVKLDREERPDVDRVYMTFVQRRTGRGGWPMTVFMTHEGKPFFGGTYFPREHLQQIVANTTTLWRDRREDLLETAEAYAGMVVDASDGWELPETDDSDAEILKTMRNALGASFDHAHGGYGRGQGGWSPKFPPHTDLLYFLDKGGGRMGPSEREQMFATLDAMERGGIHDQIGGGFHRYSTDREWLLPHFEKMLYDNALLAQAYAAAYAQTKEPRYRRVVERLFGWAEREMKQPKGGYASSLDADTEGEEGLTYTWTWRELHAALDDDELAFLAPLMGLKPEGNFQDEATGKPVDRNIPHWTQHRDEATQAKVDALFEKLHRVRRTRAQPGLDEKVITAWNGLMLSAFARAGTDLGDETLHARGRELATFLLEHCRRDDGTLLRFPRDSGPEIVGFCEDHAHVVEGLLDLADATGEERWAEAARDLGTRMNTLFLDPEKGGFFATSKTHHEVLIARAKEMWDSPIPSDNGAAARANLRLFACTSDEAFRDAADGTLAFYRSSMADPRLSAGVTALIRALTDRMESTTTGAEVHAGGDVHVRASHATIDVFTEHDRAAPGTRVKVLVRMRLDPGWHLNGAEPSSPELVATKLAAAEGAVAGLEGVTWPPTRRKAVGGEEIDLYEELVEIRAELVVPEGAVAGPRKIALVLTYQACDDSMCLAPTEVRLDVPLRFDAETGTRRHPSIFK